MNDMKENKGFIFALYIFLLLNLIMLACVLTYLCMHMPTHISYRNVMIAELICVVISISYAIYECKIKRK